MKALTCLVVTLAGSLMIAPSVVAQQERGGTSRDDDGQERLHSVLERLELGMSALSELGRKELLAEMQHLADQVRKDLARKQGHKPARENDEIRTVKHRLQIMRFAVDASIEAGDIAAAELVERAIHARELNLEGRRDYEANRIREGAPNRAQLAEALAAAAGLYREWEKTGHAQALAELSEVYAGQNSGLNSLKNRVEINRYARVAFAEVGYERNAKALEKCIHFGDLSLQGASQEQLHWASRKYAEWGYGTRSNECADLANYYLGRD